MEIEKQVLSNLKKYEIETTTKPQTLNYLCKIQEIINDMNVIREETIKKYKENKPSINQISALSGISRQTFYNNPIVVEYTKLLIETTLSDDIFTSIDNLRNEIRERDNIINKMVNRDANISLYEAKIKEMQDEILSLQQTVISQSEAINELIKNINIEP